MVELQCRIKDWEPLGFATKLKGGGANKAGKDSRANQIGRKAGGRGSKHRREEIVQRTESPSLLLNAATP